jgi:four helix bundle protein
MNKNELKQRTKSFALCVMKLLGALPENTEGRVIGSQLMRCATSVGANYRATCRGRSKADFIAKLGIVEEEANELTAIMVASRKTASLRSKQQIKDQKSKIENREGG